MQIKSAEFVRGVIGSTPFLQTIRYPQIAFVGRSNVGKSSVINSLVQRNGLVKTSSTPGKTLQINYFLINDALYFVDLPGYGYAKKSQKAREKLRRMILWYLTTPAEVHLDVLVLIVDAKAGLRDFDRDMLAIAREQQHRVIMVMNKMDKLNQREIAARKRELAEDAQLQDVLHSAIFYSAKTGRGRRDLLEALDDVLAQSEKVMYNDRGV